ncbi:MAG: hypothetical protein UV73_C0002G0095 [Candidatus Gottesmanbacteria bacterium GW2011_GWA2_43_14]|uniref:Uncharacterized protein n=1 Tax=Candidatus Gottesmanbacteria bacterium GW2011_GWA2_43_14 TaxID=1618443 RepID=A0A0G1FTM8_9BACT|nr:MAG: hypothetical protein UV73_C0002G0095 [Candidatus Gottesmanbacteria bacterium GW2011_GWA2_43_14]
MGKMSFSKGFIFQKLEQKTIIFDGENSFLHKR